MKRIKKLAALMLAAIMALAMGMTALAAETTPSAPEKKTITIENPTKGHVYTAYQILTGELVGEELTKLNWGAGITDTGKAELKKQLGLTDGATVAQVADELSKITSDSGEMDAIAQILGDNTAGAGTVLTANGTAVSATVDQGYYVVVDTEGEGAAAETTFSKYMVQVVGNVSIQTKARTTTSKKTVEDQDKAYAEFTEANIGEAKTFYLTATLPDDYAAYKAFYMNFRDTMNHMDYVSFTGVTVKRGVQKVGNVYDPKTGEIVATIDAQNGTGINGYVLTAPNAIADGEVTSTASNTLSVVLKDLKQIFAGAEAGDCVIVEYQAKLNSSAVINGANINEFDLVFSNNPNDNTVPTPETPEEDIPTGTTPKTEAEVYTTEIELLKKDGTTGDILTGAEFTLTGDTSNVVIKTATVFTVDEDGEYWKLKNETYTKDAPTEATKEHYASETEKYAPTVTTTVETNSTSATNIKAEVGKDGKVTFSGLGVGSYTLEETKVPAGYNKMDDISFEITFDRNTKEFATSGALGNLVADIANYSGSTLPSTGGIGTTIFYIVGAILVIGAGVILVTKKRMSKEV